MSEVDVHFTYVYTFRMRSNAYPKPFYSGNLLIEADTPFAAYRIGVILHGREDEIRVVTDRYSFSVSRESAAKLVHTNLNPDFATHLPTPIIFRPGEMVNVELERSLKPKPAKLRKFRDGGEGIFVEVWIAGAKRYKS